MKAIFLVLGMTLLTVGFADGGNDALAQPQTVTAGERVAQYLQSLMISAGAILEARKPGDLLNSPEVYRVGVVYEPVEKVIDLSVVGSQGDPQSARRMLELTRGLVLSFNKKLEKNFGVTLRDDDIIMDYLDAKTSRIILKFRDGHFLDPPQGGGVRGAPKPKETGP